MHQKEKRVLAIMNVWRSVWRILRGYWGLKDRERVDCSLLDHWELALYKYCILYCIYLTKVPRHSRIMLGTPLPDVTMIS